MTTIDSLLVKIINHPENLLEGLFSPRDRSVLKSLGNGVTSANFITENQSKLLVKILRENQKKLVKFDEEILEILNTPTWSKDFRNIEQVKKLYISEYPVDDKTLVIEFTFSSQIRKILINLGKNIEGLVQSSPGKLFTAELTEKNIVTLVEALLPLGFDISETIKNHYDTIKSWSENEVKNQFLITSMTNQNFQKHITEDLGVTTPIDKNIIADRGMRYQYFTEDGQKTGKNLTEKLALREKSKVWVSTADHSLSEVITSLKELKRFPVLFVFDNYDVKQSLESLKNMGKSLEENGILANIGIYFRFANDEHGKAFNQYIADNHYNCQLDEHTNAVGVQNGKIPKFMISSPWKPKAVISLGTSLRHSKTAVYSNYTDLVITYTDTKPLFDSRESW